MAYTNNEDNGKRTVSAALKIIVGVMLIIAPVAALIIYAALDSPGEPEDDISAMTGDGSLTQESKDRWVQYLKANSPQKTDNSKDVKITWDPSRPMDKVQIDTDPIIDGDNVTYSDSGDGTPALGAGEQTGAEKDQGDDMSEDRSGNEERELEESDIIKILDDRLYILNPYMGLIIVDISDPADPEIEGRLQMRGSPVSMYIVDFLAFVIVGTPMMTYDQMNSGGALHIISILDPSAPGIVKTVPLSGYPLDSRRVGEVIYLVSNMYPSYYYGYDTIAVAEREDDTVVSSAVVSSSGDDPGSGQNTDETEVVSISFSDPEKIGEVDRSTFSGTSSNIHVSQTAIFFSRYEWGMDEARTRITHVDISDPDGKISIRGSIVLTGWLNDRYQMDHYGEHLRVVTQVWGKELWGSVLYVISVKDPDDLKVVGSLDIDEAGTLMSTRFSGDRGYAIHLPRAVDPLYTIDLSDPTSPKLCDVLEMPGWVEHMEVVGYKIIAIGVDDSSGYWQVALSLFDVTDPYNAVMEDRVIMGEGWSYSPANWDPKALSVIEDLVLIPYTSYTGGYGYSVNNRIEMVQVDLENGNLKRLTSVPTDTPVTRTRMSGDSILATSELQLISIGTSDTESPTIDAVIDLASYYTDAIVREGKIVAAVSPTWGADRALIRVVDPEDIYAVVSETYVDGIMFQEVRMAGDLALIKGIRTSGDDIFWEVHAFDVSDPNDIEKAGVASIRINDAIHMPGYLPEEKYDDRETPPDTNGSEPSPSDDSTTIDIYYDPVSWLVLNDGTVIAYAYNYWTYENEGLKAWIVRWTPSGPSVSEETFPSWHYIEKAMGSADAMLLTTSIWNYVPYRYGYMDHQATALKLIRGGDVTDHMVRGSFVGASSNLSIVYTSSYWYDEAKKENGFSLNTILLTDDGPKLLDSSALSGYLYPIYADDDVIVMTEGWGWWWYRGGYYYEDDVAVDGEMPPEDDDEDRAEPSEGSGASSEEEKAYEPYVPTTTLTIIRLSEGIPESYRKLSLEGYYYSAPMEGGLFLQGDGTLIGFSITDGGLERIGSWSVSGYVNGGEYTPALGVAAMGLWGLELI
ncbi:MAG: beta-propeller domain-containing protein [Candidatus Thermoplasmatota archaeon]|nr:beta-propeller domain-containing protein [Candidatus Thermoplasmatota archaeon]